jgi:hypothetical protein
MRRLRDEESLTNREVAERLDISYGTVLRLIGPQPEGRRKYNTKVEDIKMYGSKSVSDNRGFGTRLTPEALKDVVQVVPSVTPSSLKYDFSLVSCNFSIVTENNVYSVDAKDGTVAIQSTTESGSEVSIVIKQGEMFKFGEEIKEVSKIIASKLMGFASMTFNKD